jgi:hypothetical protein
LDKEIVKFDRQKARFELDSDKKLPRMTI